ncbi:sensor histidine kinase [Pollutimonas sp. M17]|uniref:sensor histidine kinase n=1 Tax=Pollutimonas sp. M17 TaxID=2962065 RepID=UPI0021F3FBFD|nr:HAMP domain-containing sensor histidine kinase [Pollutimonas sp. M17]UYO93059.1 HAMP domain-containing histidine kinase [Pollutimonas sp. M17]
MEIERSGRRSMMARYSLMQRVTWALTGSATLFVVVLCAVFYLSFDQMEDDLVNAVLATEVEHMLGRLEQGQAIPTQQSQTELGAQLQTWLIDGRGDEALLPAPLRGIGLGTHVLGPGDQTWHVLVAQAPKGTLYVLYDATAHEARVHEFGWIVLILGAVCIAAVFALSRWLAGLVVGPLLDLADHLSNWAPGAPDISVRRDDEVGRLIETFNRVQGRVEESLAFEREFAFNLSHEIRGALAALRTDAEMLLLDDAMASTSRRRLERMVAQADLMAGSIASAESLSRDLPAVDKEIDLRECLDEAWLAFEAEARRRGLDFANEIPAGMRRVLDPYAFLTVVRNLMRNAAEHAAPATLRASCLDDHTLAFSDDGPGIPSDALPLLFERYFSTRRKDAMADGQAPDTAGIEGSRRGLGLAIARQMCKRKHWTLTVESSVAGPGRGTTFILRLGDGPAARPY